METVRSISAVKSMSGTKKLAVSSMNFTMQDRVDMADDSGDSNPNPNGMDEQMEPGLKQGCSNSMVSLTSQELFENALRDILKQNTKPTGWCRGEPLTDRGKRKQLIKMLVLVFVPVLALWCLSLQTLSDDVNEKNATERTETILRLSTELGEIIHRLQVERDMSVFYYSTLGPATKSFLLTEYDKTDMALLDLSRWPGDLDVNGRPEFSSKEAFQLTLSSQRLRLGADGEDMYKEIQFYTSAITVFIQWLYDSIRESKYGTIWKPLVAYLKIVTGKDDIGIERALGSNFYVKGKFQREYDYQWYLQKCYMSKNQFRSAKNYSPIVKPVLNYGITVEGGNLSNLIEELRTKIMMNGRSGVQPSTRKGQQWYDTMTLYLEVLLDQQLELADIIAEQLTSNIDSKTQKVAISATLLVLVILLCPIVIIAMESLTSDIQRFAITLVDKTKELSREKRKTDTLLYQMVPKPVADILKKSGEVEAEYYKAVTVFFSDIVGFAQITSEVTPMEVVTLLNNLYTFMDGVLDHYDVYKVETINDSYMIASGLPKRNGDSHSSEIANLALDLIRRVNERRTFFIPSRQISLRIGINTGPVVAGIVGSKMPRYCLFGDTVNTASRMESNGLANRIHISASTRGALLKQGGYITQCRGIIPVKGKGNLTTYFLIGKGESSESIEEPVSGYPHAIDELPGEITCLPDYPPKTMVPLKKQIALAAKAAETVEDLSECDELPEPVFEPSKDGGPDTVVELREGFHY